MKERDNVLRIFKETEIAVEKKDTATLKSLSNQTINTASLTHDADNIAVAVIVYALSKIIERSDYKELRGWNEFYKIIVSSLKMAIVNLEKNNEVRFRKNLLDIRRSIGKLSGKLKKYIQEVFRMASISKASRIYEHGISMEKTAKLLGISLYELAEYAGKTGISDVPLSKTISVRDRIKLVKELFK